MGKVFQHNVKTGKTEIVEKPMIDTPTFKPDGIDLAKLKNVLIAKGIATKEELE